MWAPRLGSWRGAEVSTVGATRSETLVVGGDWAAPGVAYEVGGGVSAGAGCVAGGTAVAGLGHQYRSPGSPKESIVVSRKRDIGSKGYPLFRFGMGREGG